MWGGEKIENEIERLVKILTKCKMKLKSRRRRDKIKLWNQADRGQSAASLRFIHSRRFTLLPPCPAHSRLPHSPPPSATSQKSQTSSYPCPSCPTFPSFFIKLPKRQSRSVAVVAWRGTQLAGPAVAVRPARSQARALPVVACPLPSPLPPVSGCALSAAEETIGKQRPKMRFPVSSSSLTNK